MKALLVFPHQLFEVNPLFSEEGTFYIIEEYLFFNQYQFHKQKIVYHRTTLKTYADFLQSKKKKIVYVDAQDPLSDIRVLIQHLNKKGYSAIAYIDTSDNWLEKRIQHTCSKANFGCTKYPSPYFLNTPEELRSYFLTRKKFFQTDFYIHQRKTKHILVDEKLQPAGGKWTYDQENRLKYPKAKIPPAVIHPEPDVHFEEAKKYCEKNYTNNYGNVSIKLYPTNFKESKEWLDQFLKNRFAEFGPYEDAIVQHQHFLHHSILTPLLNIGLLTPDYVIEKTLAFAKQEKIPIASSEGFIRQILGWREFMRAVYELRGVEARTKNYWKFKRKIPASFWNGTTGIEPVDDVIKKVLLTGYCHHIERLMVLGNFMLLCEFDPDEVYRWFMELFIDAYDWVMVPNVYSMSQFADGGIMATKPYISGSNYVMKMSDYKKGNWQELWDGLFWRFMYVHSNFFSQNPRLGMLLKTFEKMPEEKKNHHISIAEKYLSALDKL